MNRPRMNIAIKVEREMLLEKKKRSKRGDTRRKKLCNVGKTNG